MIKPFTTWLATNLSLTVGTTLFCGYRPDTAPIACSVVLERVGPYVQDVRVGDAGSQLKNVTEYHFQVLTRAASYMAARDEAFRIYDFVFGKANEALTGWTLLSALSQAGPQYIDGGARGSYEFSANYVIRAQKAN